MAEVYINGPAGRLEGRFERSENPRAPIALILHPDPLQGGTMNNRVTYTLFQSFLNLGFSALRFNFRGIGKSQGEIDGTGVGELADAISVLDWIQSVSNENNPCWIAGYAFGAWIGAQVLMRRPEITGFVFSSVQTQIHSFDFLSPCPASGLIIHPENDIYTPKESAILLAEQLDSYNFVNVDYKEIPNADYLYTNQLKSLHETILKSVPEILTRKINPSAKKSKPMPIFEDEDY